MSNMEHKEQERRITMKKTNRIYALVLILALMLCLTPGAFAASASGSGGILDPLGSLVRCDQELTWQMKLKDVKTDSGAMILDNSFIVSVEIAGESGFLMGSYNDDGVLVGAILSGIGQIADTVKKALEESELLDYMKEEPALKEIKYYQKDGSCWTCIESDDGVVFMIYAPEDLATDNSSNTTETGADAQDAASEAADDAIMLSFGSNRYNAGLWNVPVLDPETEIDKCTRFTLCFRYNFISADSLGQQRVFVSLNHSNGAWYDCGTINVPKEGEVYRQEFVMPKPRTIGGIAVLPVKASEDSFSVTAWLEDVQFAG